MSVAQMVERAERQLAEGPPPAPAPESGFTFWCSVNGQRASVSVERAAVLGLAQFVRSVVARGRCADCKAGNHCGQCEGCCD